MDEKAKNFFAKKNIPFQDIIYFVRQNHKTELHLTNGNVIVTYLPIKVLLTAIPSGILLSINKGIVIAKAHVTNINNNVYTMIDGATFTGRVRTPGRHLLNKYELMSNPQNLKLAKAANANENLPAKFSILDDMPLAFCIIELVFDKNGKGMDFIFRYCNKEMEQLEGVPMDEMLNRSFYEVFKNGDKKWLITYADVAINGTPRVINCYSPEIDSQLNIYCFQPAPNFCACSLIKC